MHIWRMETATGEGPYNATLPSGDYIICLALYIAGEKPNATGKQLYGTERHPTPWFDPLIATQTNYWQRSDFDKYYCGFKSLKQYRQWINKAAIRRALTMLAVDLVCYEVATSAVIIGETQAIFIKEQATIVEIRRCDYAD